MALAQATLIEAIVPSVEEADMVEEKGIEEANCGI